MASQKMVSLAFAHADSKARALKMRQIPVTFVKPKLQAQRVLRNVPSAAHGPDRCQPGQPPTRAAL
jgi:hypothetical protein